MWDYFGKGAFSGKMDDDGPVSNLSLRFGPVGIDSICVVGEGWDNVV